MPFIVLETHGGAEYTAIVTDQEGNNMVFYSLDAAQTEADDCQQGVIVTLDF